MPEISLPYEWTTISVKIPCIFQHNYSVTTVFLSLLARNLFRKILLYSRAV